MRFRRRETLVPSIRRRQSITVCLRRHRLLRRRPLLRRLRHRQRRRSSARNALSRSTPRCRWTAASRHRLPRRRSRPRRERRRRPHRPSRSNSSQRRRVFSDAVNAGAHLLRRAETQLKRSQPSIASPKAMPGNRNDVLVLDQLVGGLQRPRALRAAARRRRTCRPAHEPQAARSQRREQLCRAAPVPPACSRSASGVVEDVERYLLRERVGARRRPRRAP